MPPLQPDPGRMTAHRLNRNEYTNTIRDLLGVRFRAERDFPVDDSADGFDNIGDVLTVSPLLMERYLAAAERIAGWAMATDTLPAKPLEIGYHAREQRIRRADRSTIEAEHRVEFAGEYIVRFGLPGERPARRVDAAPVTLGFWMDGKLLATQTVETKPSGLVYFNPYSEEEFRLYLPEGDHVFRAGFIDDDFVQTLPGRGRVQPAEEQVPRLDHLRRTVPVEDRKGEPQEDPHPAIPSRAAACVEKILANLARRAYRRPATRRGSRFASAFRGPREGRRAVRRAGIAARDPGDAGLAATSCSASSAIRIRATPRRCTRCRRSSWRRGSATSSGARCRTTSCWRSPRPASCATRVSSKRR